ncbi:hypothetical protein [Sediminibacillus massiliensis]|nr:hypothetical protein [Sediminibacillus massiliensis]
MYKMQWKVSEFRKDKDKKPQEPVKRSEYAKQLFEIGAGWNE